jgi:MFS family permease
MLSKIPRSVWVLSLVSFFTDISSEMLYPVMPVYLKSIGFTFIGIGVLEGIAEAVAGLSKIYFGRISDRKGNYNQWVSIGYSHSFVSKLLLAISSNIYIVFASRLIDRIGKGIRTAPRDALLSLSSTKTNEAGLFAFHRSFDTLGAALGPLIALFILFKLPGDYKTLFTLATIPAFIGVLFTFLIKKAGKSNNPTIKKLGIIDVLQGKGIQSPHYMRSIAPILIFAVINSSDAFLLLKLKDAGWEDTHVILAYITYNILYALLAWPAGIIADKIGIKIMLIVGLIFFSLTYLGFAFLQGAGWYYLLFVCYSIYAACMESNSKAFLSKFLNKNEKAGGLGFAAGWQSIALLTASTWTGIMWQGGYAQTAFTISAAGAILAAFLLVRLSYSSIIE